MYANANLIAQAPALLEAAEALLLTMPFDLSQPEVTAMRAAIAATKEGEK